LPLFKSKLIFKYYILLIIGSMISGLLGKYISEFIASIFSIDLIPAMKGAGQVIEIYGLAGSFFILLIWAPVIEEMAFRLWIVYSPEKLLKSIIALMLIILLNINIYYKSSFLLSLIMVLTIFIIVNKLKIIFPAKLNLDIKYRIILSGISFGFIHLMRFELDVFYWYTCIPLVLPQVFSGIFFGYIRVRNGFRYNLTLHFLINATSYLATLIT